MTKTTKPMIGNPSVEYIAGYFAWTRGKTFEANPYWAHDKVSALRWSRGFNYAAANAAASVEG